MNHPTNEEWMAYLYDEVTSAEKAQLTAHCQACRECQVKLAGWEGTAQALNAWELPATPAVAAPRQTAWNYVKWGVAAMLMLGAGFGIARATAPAAPTVASIRAALEPEMRALVRREMNQVMTSAIAQANAESQRLVAGLASRQEDDRVAISEILQDLEMKRLNEMARLRGELETVAVNAESGFETLASYTRPVAAATIPAHPEN